MNSKEKLEYQKLIAERDFKWLADRIEGRRFMRRIFSETGVYQSVFSHDPVIMAYQEGRRAVGLWLLEQFADNKEQYVKLLTDRGQDDT